MPSKSTRRSISFRAEVFERMRRYCEKHGVSLSRFCEEKLMLVLDVAEEPQVSRDEALRARGILPDTEVEQMRKAVFG